MTYKKECGVNVNDIGEQYVMRLLAHMHWLDSHDQLNLET